jgi:fluoride exporter
VTHVLAVAAGGALGSVLRYWMASGVHAFAGRAFPYGTLAVNIAGCLLMGFLFVLFAAKPGNETVLRTALLVGVLGGFTTFSAFSIETFNLIEAGAWLKAGLNAGLSVLLCLVATWIGVLIARQL